jgi:hypothetical protein
MKIIIPGGRGQIGTILARAFTSDGHEVVVLSRTAAKTAWRVMPWDGQTLGPWSAELDGADVVINLAGRSVNCRYNETNRRQMIDSRVQATRAVGLAITKAANPPPLWLQASTATIYAHRFDAPNDEFTGIIGGSEPNAPEKWRFSIDVATKWEQAANESETPATRKVLMRSAMTMSPDRGGIFDVLLGLVRKGLGGKSGDGKQFVSWIHEQDFIRAIYWLIEHKEISGPVNLTSPNPLINAEFMAVIRAAWGTRIGLPATRWMLEIGAIPLQTETELILKSRRVIPGKLLQGGFEFLFPNWPEAAKDLVERWRGKRIVATDIKADSH